MALFKILKGSNATLNTSTKTKYAKEGYAYFAPDKGYLYIDIDGNGSSTTPIVGLSTESTTGANRIKVAAGFADQLRHALTISADGNGSTGAFDGSGDFTLSYNSIGAAAASHDHTLSVATTTDTANANGSFGGKIKITVGNNSKVFSLPSLGTTSTTAAAGNHTHAKLTIQGNGTAAIAYTPGSSSDTTLNIKAGSNISVTAGTGTITIAGTYATATSSAQGLVKPKYDLNSNPTVASQTSTSGRYYGVEINSQGALIVNVPWVNTWDALSTSQAGYVAKAPNDTTKFLRGDAQWAALPAASSSAAGIVKLGVSGGAAAYATTLSGYHIADAYINGSSVTLGSTSITVMTGLSVTGSGNAITSLTFSEGTLTASKGASYAASDHTQAVNKGGTNITSYAVGNLIYASAETTLAKLAPNTTTTQKFLVQKGTGTAGAAPEWHALVADDIPSLSTAKISNLSAWAGSTSLTTLGTVTTGTWKATTIAVAYGGTGLTAATKGDILYASADNTWARLAANVTQTRKFLRQVGTSDNTAQAPVWDTVTKSDVGLSNVENTKLSTWSGTSNITTVGTITTGTWNGSTIAAAYIGSHSTDKLTSGTLGTSRGGTGKSTWDIYSVVYVSAANTLGQVGPNTTTTKKFLRMTGTSTGTGAAPVWDTVTKDDVGLGNVENTALSTWAGSANITKVGTIATGTWQGTAIAAAYIGNHSTDKLTSGTLGTARGGTGLASFTQYAIYYASTTSVLTAVTNNTSATRKFLRQVGNGTASAAPAWDTLVSGDLPIATASAIGGVKIGTGIGVSSGTISVTYGTAASTALQGNQKLFTLNGTAQYASSPASFYAPTASGTTNQILVSKGASAAPEWLATANGAAYATSANGSLQFGTLPIAQGGTGSSTTPTQGGIIYASTTAAFASTGAGTAGDVLSSNAASAPTWITPTSTNTASALVKRDSNGDFAARIITATRLIATSTTDSTGSGQKNTALITGTVAGTHIEYDTDEIQAMGGEEGATASTLHLNYGGGNVIMGAANGTYNVTIRSTTAAASKTTGALVVGGGAGFGGTVWANAFNGPLTGNATSASKLETARSISLSTDATGSASFNGTANVTIAVTLANSGVTTGSYGPSANASPAFGGTFSVPLITVDAKGRVTSASSKTITVPALGTTATTAAAGNHNHDSAYVNVGGDTMTGQLILSKTTDAAGTAANACALIIGGTQTAQHIEIDGNEILSKSNDTTPGTLYLQDATGTVSVAGSGGLAVTATTASTSKTTGALRVSGGVGVAGDIYANTVHNAVWNDYAEYRKTNEEVQYGQCVIDNDDGSLSIAEKRLLPGAQVVSDTWGTIMGETEEAKTPVAVAGRVLVYPYRSRTDYHAGMAVCTAPNGTVDIMTREEIMMYPDCIVGIVSEIPAYTTWGENNVQVNGRIWIKVR